MPCTTVYRGTAAWVWPIAFLMFGVALEPCPGLAQRSGNPDPEGQIATSSEGMVVSAEPLATEVGVQVLEAGGNAVDAAVATAFALAVVEPSMSGIGGRTQMVIRTPAGEFSAIDGGTEVPAHYRPEASGEAGTVGYATIGIPGTVAALANALDRFGTMPWAEVMAPAIALAEGGYPLPAAEARRMGESAETFIEFEATRRIFLKPDGSRYQAGDWFVQPDLAETLRTIAEGGAEAFYRGEIAQRIADDMESNGAHLTLDDLNTYRAEPSKVVRGSYRGYEIVGSYLPASGVTSIQILQIMDRFDLSAIGGTPAWAAIVGQALRIGFEDRSADFGPPEVKARLLTSPEWAQRRALEVRVPGADGSERAGFGVMAHAGLQEVLESDFTTHLSVADRDGGMVALTQSLGSSFGSHVVTPGLGFVYASTLNYTQVLPGSPRPRPMTSQSPLLVMRDGEPVLVLGAAGGRRIISAIVSVVSRALDEHLPFLEAMNAPRVHALGAGRLELEGREGNAWTDDAFAELSDLGIEVERGAGIARIHGIHFDRETRRFTGIADARGGGSAAGPRGGPFEAEGGSNHDANAAGASASALETG